MKKNLFLLWLLCCLGGQVCVADEDADKERSLHRLKEVMEKSSTYSELMQSAENTVFTYIDYKDYSSPIYLGKKLASSNDLRMSSVAKYILFAAYHAMYIDTELPIHKTKAAAYLKLFQEDVYRLFNGELPSNTGARIELNAHRRNISWEEGMLLSDNYVTDEADKLLVDKLIKSITTDYLLQSSFLNIENDRFMIVVDLLKRGMIQIDDSNSEDGTTLLHMAVFFNNSPAVKSLLDLGSSCTVTDHGEDNVYDYAKELNLQEMKNLLDERCRD